MAEVHVAHGSDGNPVKHKEVSWLEVDHQPRLYPYLGRPSISPRAASLRDACEVGPESSSTQEKSMSATKINSGEPHKQARSKDP